jgi:hypothetical protein
MPPVNFNVLATPTVAAERAALSRPPISIDVGDQNAVPPAILRGGIQVVPPVVNELKVNDFVDRLVPVDRLQVPRVISQSVPANTRVAVGTTIDLVLVPVSDIQVGLLGGTHPDVVNVAVPTLLNLVQDPTIAPILQRTIDPATVTAAEKATITAAFLKVGPNIKVDEADPTRNFATAFSTLQSARSFE